MLAKAVLFTALFLVFLHRGSADSFIISSRKYTVQATSRSPHYIKVTPHLSIVEGDSF